MCVNSYTRLHFVYIYMLFKSVSFNASLFFSLRHVSGPHQKQSFHHHQQTEDESTVQCLKQTCINCITKVKNILLAFVYLQRHVTKSKCSVAPTSCGVTHESISIFLILNIITIIATANLSYERFQPYCTLSITLSCTCYRCVYVCARVGSFCGVKTKAKITNWTLPIR